MAVSVVTCVTGNFNKVHKTDISEAYVVTTLRDESFKNHCKDMGWKVVYLDYPHTNDLYKATRQSKYVKTLKAFKPRTKHVIYVDHKYIIENKHIQPLIDTIGDEPFLSFKNPKTVYREFYDSMAYDRYVSTISEIRRNVNECGEAELFYGGLIMYNTQHSDFERITAKMNAAIERYNHAQDQFLFPLSIKDEKKVLIHNTIGLEHKSPQPQIQGLTY